LGGAFFVRKRNKRFAFLHDQPDNESRFIGGDGLSKPESAMIRRQGQENSSGQPTNGARSAEIGLVVPKPQRRLSPQRGPVTPTSSPQQVGQATPSLHSSRPSQSRGQLESPAQIEIEIDDQTHISFFHRLPSWLASAVVHTVLLVLLACWTLNRVDDTGPITLKVSAGAPSIIDDAFELAAPMELEDESVAAKIALPVNAELTLDEINNDATINESINLDNPLGGQYDQNALADAFDKLGAARRAAAALKESKKDKASFLGVEASGSKFVFVVDRSGSMAGARWLQARHELINSIKSLHDTQEFFIILYNESPSAMLGRTGRDLKLVKASKENIELVEKWLFRQIPAGNTSPKIAMRLALDLEADSVFLLSDGEFRDGTVEDLQRRNRHRDGERKGMVKTAIHCISFKSLAGAATLKFIADQNSGTFAFVE
jgi:hypothetical protein